MRVRIGTVVFVVTALTVASASTASAASTVLQWAVAGSTGAGALYAADTGTTVGARKVVQGVATVMDFGGWLGSAPDDELSPTDSMLSTDANFAEDSGGGSDGGDASFDPESTDFTVSVWANPTHAAQFPRGSIKSSAISPNLVQKGRINSPGGYWKVSTEMVRVEGVGLRWAPICTFRAASGELLNVNAGQADQFVMLDQTIGYTLSCEIDAGTATLTVTPDDGAPDTRSLTATGPFSLSNDSAVSVGHKPETTSATDIYDGLLGQLTITKS